MKIIKVAFFFTLILCYQATVFAFKVTPMLADFEPSGPMATQTFIVTNPDNVKVAIEVEAATRKHLEDGKELRDPTEDFSIYPLQFTVEPKQKRSVRVSYVGKKNSSDELAYRLIFRQLPVDVKKPTTNTPTTQINFLFEYVASVYVTIANGLPSLKAGNVIKSDKAISLILKNEGNKHTFVKDYNITITDGSKTVQLKPSDFGDDEVRNILPHEQASVSFTPPAGMNLKKITVLKIERK